MNTLHARLCQGQHHAALAGLLNGRPAADLPFMNRSLWQQFLHLLAALQVGKLSLHLPDQDLPDLDEAQTFGIEITSCEAASRMQALAGQRMLADRSERELLLSLDCLPYQASLQAMLAVSSQHHLQGISVPDRQLVAIALAQDAPCHAWLEIGVEPVAELDGVMRYYEAHMQALAHLPHWQRYERRIGEQMLAGHHLKLDESVLLDDALLLGDFVRVEAGCVLRQSVIGHDCLIGENCEIDQSIILPGSHIGGHMHLYRKIVDGNRVIDPFRHCILVIDDPLLLSHTHHHGWRMQTC